MLIIGLTRAANLIIGLKPVEPLALIEEARARVKNHGWLFCDNVENLVDPPLDASVEE